jgi:hypothetical protein
LLLLLIAVDQKDLGSRASFQAMAVAIVNTLDWDDGDDDAASIATTKPLPRSY